SPSAPPGRPRRGCPPRSVRAPRPASRGRPARPASRPRSGLRPGPAHSPCLLLGFRGWKRPRLVTRPHARAALDGRQPVRLTEPVERADLVGQVVDPRDRLVTRFHSGIHLRAEVLDHLPRVADRRQERRLRRHQTIATAVSFATAWTQAFAGPPVMVPISGTAV